MHTYDLFGWYDADALPGRNAGIAPSNLSVSDVPGELRANWTGYEWQEMAYQTPPEIRSATPVPQKVSRAQFILALLQIDLLDEVEAAIALADRATQINYSERLEFERSFPLIATMAAALGKTDAEIDALFVLAAML
jgi:hypothetical protein